MRLRFAGLLTVGSALVVATALAGPIPPGRQHLLTIEGENIVTFVPQANLPEFKLEYRAKFEYIVDSRYGKEPKPTSTEEKDQVKDEDDSTTKPIAKATSKKTKSKKAESPASKATGAIDVSLHSSERTFRQNGLPLVDMKVSRTRFQGRLQAEMPIMSVAAKDAPLPLQEIMKGFDVIVASLLLNDDLKVVSRKIRNEGPQRAVTETILSIHVPIPRNADSWESPTQLVMGQGQTAKGTLRFEKVKVPVIAASKEKEKESKEKEKAKETSLVKVKVSGVLKSEGVVADRFIKDGTFTVNGEQTFDMKTHDWVASRWSVAVDSELANPAGLTTAHSRGTMTVQSKALEVSNPGPSNPADAISKP
jgi:hypothetical protein